MTALMQSIFTKAIEHVCESNPERLFISSDQNAFNRLALKLAKRAVAESDDPAVVPSDIPPDVPLRSKRAKP
jgi:hypothetical protein